MGNTCVRQPIKNMRSKVLQLKSRGYLTEKEYDIIINDCFDQSKAIVSFDPVIRTAGYRFIKNKKNYHDLKELCACLRKEDKLYSKIELFACLESIGIKTLEYLDAMIGEIGNNRHKAIGNYDLGKKGYPLPRDIAARVIIRMGRDVLKYYKTRLENYEETKLLEIIDLIGHITYTTRDYVLEEDLIGLYRTKRNELIRWKLIRAFQSFNSIKIIEILKNENENSNEIIRKEALRSMDRIKKRSMQKSI